MARTRPSVFRDAFQISPGRVAALDDADLSELMRELLCAHAYRCGAAISRIRVNTESRAKDAGSDGWSPKPTLADTWFGNAETCWQFKAGTAGEPARLRGEVAKRIPKETLAAGGRFVLVASGSTSGTEGENARLEVLRQNAKTANLPTAAIQVLGSERLAIWCNQHPAVAARWAGGPEGLWRLEDWMRSDEHQVTWQSTPSLQQQIADGRREMDFVSGATYHLHIQGPPGVGKTRLALELCREAGWRGHVIYIQQASDVRLLELIDGAVADEGVRLVVVADEAQPEQLRSLRDALSRGQGRIRLITIGHSKTPDPRRIPAISVSPLDRQPMSEVIKGWYPLMPQEHVDFVVRFADGYVRLARLAADAVAREPGMNVRGLLDLDHIRAFLDGMLGVGNRTALYVVAVLSSVGWTDDRQSEGEAVARHFGLNWNSVRVSVEEFHRRFGIAPRGGRYRYISPTPLGIHLAVEAWTIFPDLMKTLPNELPTEEAKDAYYERLQAIASNPQARQFARDELSRFSRIENFIDARATRRWSALSAADPALAARNLVQALSTVAPEVRAQIAMQARREAVRTLCRLVWRSSAFRNAVTALALLAESENESWANNATAEFVARFQVFLGGTAAPYLDRLVVLDELLALGRPTLGRLVVRALTQVGKLQESRIGGAPASDELPEIEWCPRTGAEHLACAEQAIGRLTAIATTGMPDLRADLVKAADDLAMLLREGPVRTFVAEFFEAVHGAYPDARESLMRSIADVLHREQKYWKEIPAENLASVQELHRRFEDSSLAARLRQYVGKAFWDPEDRVDLTDLATELVGNRDALVSEWPWLTSGEAEDGWRLGEALAEADAACGLDSVLPDLSGHGRDLRVLCGYVRKRREQSGTSWFDDWMTTLARRPSDTLLLFEISWRCGVTPRTARLVAAALRESDVDAHAAGQLAFVPWGEDLPAETLTEVLRALIDRGHLATAIALLAHRLKSRSDETEEWDDLALDLATSGDLIRSSNMTCYYWNEVTSRLVGRYARRIAAAIFREQSDRQSSTWFADHSEAGAVLRQCVKADPVGVWDALMPHLSSSAEGYLFSVGFPRGLLEGMPSDHVGRWISERAEERAPLVARLVTKDLSTDDTMASRILGSFGDNEGVTSAFFSVYVSGAFTGPASAHWTSLADALEEVARRTALPKLRRWAEDSVQSLRRMAEGDLQREEEYELRRR